MKEFSEEHWNRRSAALAKIAATDRIDQRWDAEYFAFEDVTWIFNNWCYKDSIIRRDKQLDDFRKDLAFLASVADNGFEEVAYNEYPERGSEEGYTYVMLVRSTEYQFEKIRELYEDSLQLHW